MPIVIGTLAGTAFYLMFPDPTIQGAAIAVFTSMCCAMFGVWLAWRF